MEMSEGPFEHIIPEKKELTCSGCKWLKSSLRRSGHDPIRRYNCIHESAPKSQYKLLHENLSTNIFSGDITPGSWCPFPVRDKYFDESL